MPFSKTINSSVTSANLVLYIIIVMQQRESNYPRRLFSRVYLFVCLSVCLFFRALKGKRLELSTPNLVHIYSNVVTRHALTQRSKGQRPTSHGYKNRHGRTVACDVCCYGRVLLLPAWAVLKVVRKRWGLPLTSCPLFLIPFFSLPPHSSWAKTWGLSSSPRAPLL